MRLIRAKDYNDVSRKAANIIAAQIYLKPDCVLGLATGSSPVGTYKELIAKYEAGDLDFSKVRTVNLDEYVGLTKDHDQSYAYFMRSNLFDHVNIDQNNCNITDHSRDLQTLLPAVQVTLPEKQPPKLLPEKLGKPVDSRPGENFYTRVSSALESLLNAAENIK